MTGTLHGVPLPLQSSFIIQTMGPENNTAVERNAAGFPTITISCGACEASSVSEEMQRQFNDEEVCKGLLGKDHQSSCSSKYDIVWTTDGSIIITVTPKSDDTDNTVIYIAIAVGVLLAIVIIVAVVCCLKKMMMVAGGKPADSAAASEEGASGAAQGQGNTSAPQVNTLHNL